MKELSLLDDLRVVEMATMVFVPAAAVMLADFGADVIKVEPPGTGDINRRTHNLPGMPASDVPYPFVQDNRGKRSLALDLKHRDGIQVLHRLLESADVFMTNVRPRALARLGLGWPELESVNPRLIYAVGTGYGEHGPDADKPGYDVVCYWSRSALAATVFPADGWLGPIPFGSGDHPGSLALFGAILLGLKYRERTGRGTKVSTSLLAAGAWGNSTTIQARLCDAEFPDKWRRDEAPGIGSIHFKSSDERAFQIAWVDDAKDWGPLCRAVDRPELVEDPRFASPELRKQHSAELIAELDRFFLATQMSEISDRLADADISYSVLSDYDDVAEDPQMAANGIFAEIEQPGHGSFRTVRSPVDVVDAPQVAPRPAPALAEHSVDILGELGYDAEEIRTLVAAGVVGRPSNR
jgi:formyl-CoA transferase